MPFRIGNPFVALGRFVRSHTLAFVVYALVVNTALAQLFYNSAGVVLPTSDWRGRYLICSAVLSMVAFSLFELHTVRQLKELIGKEKAVRQGLPRWELPGHVATLAVISLYNIYSLALLNAAIWPDLHLVGIPEFSGPAKYYFHAVMYSLILFLAAVVGERKKSAAEVAAEKDDALQAEMIEGSDRFYRELIAKGGRNVVLARQVLSTKEAAERQQQLLVALEQGVSSGAIVSGSVAALRSPLGEIASSSARSAEDEDQLRARMLQEGYPLADLDAAANAALWHSLTEGVRRRELGQLIELTEAQIIARIAEIARLATERGR